MRTFIAIDLDAGIKDILLEFIGRLRRQPSVKWAGVQGLHITLKFLGEISEDEAKRVESALRTVAGMHPKFPLGIKGTGTFPPNARNPRVLWAGIEESQALAALQADVDGALEGIGFPKEERAFHPHLTLGRTKYPSDIKETLSILAKNADTIFGRMTVEKITFFKSTLKSQGAVYSIISEARLP